MFTSNTKRLRRISNQIYSIMGSTVQANVDNSDGDARASLAIHLFPGERAKWCMLVVFCQGPGLYATVAAPAFGVYEPAPVPVAAKAHTNDRIAQYVLFHAAGVLHELAQPGARELLGSGCETAEMERARLDLARPALTEVMGRLQAVGCTPPPQYR
jgi:hypothetical protein